MPPKINHRRKNNKPSTNKPPTNKPPTPGALADCVLPQDVMFSIVTRLPVKSVNRFKAVCKPWLKLFGTPKFMKAHHAQLSLNPEHQSALISSFIDENGGHTISLFRIEPTQVKKTIDFIHPFPRYFYHMDLVGCVNGLICLACPLHKHPMPGHWIELWNPALKMAKTVPLPKLKAGDGVLASVGFGYDDESDDFKLVRIVHVDESKRKLGKKKTIAGVEVYSANSNSWRTIPLGFQFSVAVTKNHGIVNGNPYWVAKLDKDDVLVAFDVRKMAFRVVVPLPSFLNLGEHVDEVAFVDWKGAAAALVSKKNSNKRVLSLEVWVLDDVEKVWVKNRSFGPMDLKVDRFVQCLQNGEIVGECPDGNLFVLDADDDEDNGGVVKKIVIDEADKGSFQINGYTESLAYFKGMEKMKKKPYVKHNDWGRKAADMNSFMKAFANRKN